MNEIFERIKNQVVGVEMDGADLATIFQEELEQFGVGVAIYSVGDQIDQDSVTVNGYFNSFDWEEEENIELVLIMNDEEELLTINTDSWEFLQHQAQQTIEHEMIHREQIKKRDGLVVMPLYLDGMDEKQKRIVYLSDPDEIDAYANDITLDLLKNYTYQGAYSRLREYKKIRQDECPILAEYVDIFGWDSDIVRTIVLKALKRLET